MFTGIITHQGTIYKISIDKSVYFQIKVNPSFIVDLKIGDSIAVSGTCLTVIDIGTDWFGLQLIPETIALTCFAKAKFGDNVNLEKAMILGQRLDGHIVQGHIDGVGIVSDYLQEQDKWILKIDVPQNIRKYIAYKGSVCLNGVSLTVSAKTQNGFEVSLITHTLDNTNLGQLRVNDIANVEIDVIARYVENMI